MLCRALLAAVVLSYVLCVLLLSGVQKEDIDAGTLRKLQRHNVNIDDINDQQLRKQCLGKTNIPVTILTQGNPVTEKIITEIITEKEIPFEKDKVGAEDRSNLRKLFEFLEDNRKGEKKNALKSKYNSSTLRPAPNSILRSSSPYRSRDRYINVKDTSRETSEIKGTSVTDKDDEKSKKAAMNKKLENLINIWRSDIDTVSYTTRQEITTEKVIKDDPISKNNVDYIKKIVEEIMSKKKINEAQTDSNATFKKANRMSGAKSQNKTIIPTNYYLNHCKLGNFYTHYQDDKDKYATFDNDKQLISGTNEPVTNTIDEDYVICKRIKDKEKKMLTDRIHDNVVNHLLNKLKQESQRIKPDNESNNRPKSADSNQQNNDVKTSNTYRKGPLDNEIFAAFKNSSESFIPNKQSDGFNTRDDYKNGLGLLDPATAIALEAALEKQTNIYNQIFSRQRDQVQMSNTNKERIKLFENERRKVLQSALIAHPPTFNYKSSKQDDDIENKEYNKLRFVLEPRENVIINNVPDSKKEKSTNTLNTMEYGPNLGKQYKRPWFYSEVSNGQLRTKNKEKLKGIFFIPNNKIIRTEPNQKNTINKKWSPYFDAPEKNASIIEADENETPKSQQPILVDSYGLIQLNNREISQELTENSKKHSNAIRLYHNKKYSPNIIKDQSGEQFETKKDKKINESHCRTIHETKTCFPDAEYKSDWTYIRNKQIEKQILNMKEQNEGSEYFNYQFPSRPRATKNRYEKYIAEEELANRNETKDSVKFPAFPQNVIKDIANSIKEIVLKDLITTTIIPLTTTTPSTATSSPITMTTTTTTPTTTITKSTMIITTTKTTEGTSTAGTKQPLKTQDESKALEKIIEMIEKISSIKEKKAKHDNVTYREDVHYDTEMEATTQTIINRQEQLVQQKTKYRLAYDPQSLQPNLEKQTPYVPQPFQPNPENRVPYQQQPLQYIPQAVQMKADNSTPYVPPAMQLRGSNRLPYVPQPSQSNPESRTPYFPQAVQLPAQNRLPYDPHNLQSNLANRGPYFPPALQLKAENRIPDVLQTVQMKTENRTPNGQQAVQMKTENNIPRNPYDQQNLQSKLENREPYFPPATQMRAEKRIPYSPQAVQMKTENNLPRDPHTLQSNPENLTPYFTQSLQQKSQNCVPYDSQPFQRNPEIRLPNDQPPLQNDQGNRVVYDQQPLQNNLGNRVPYDPQPLQSNPENHVPYDQPPLQNNLGNRVPYDPQPFQSNPGNRVPYDQSPIQNNPGNRVPYDQPPLQNNLGNRVTYDPQPLLSNPGNRVPYDQPPLQNNLGNRVPYDPQPLPSYPDNRASYLPQPLQFTPQGVQLKTENRVPYDPQPLQRGPNLYSIKNPYYNSKIELDPYQDKEVLEPIKQKHKPRKYAITVQTNSGEIAPLKIAVQKPVLQTIVLTTKSPANVERLSSGEIFNDRKPKSVSTRHQVDKPKESEISNNGEIKQYFSRHIQRDAYGDRPKSRKIKIEREVTQQYKPRGFQDIERFHEKLERGDAWAQYEEEKIAKRVQRPIVKNTNYDDTHFRNFLQTQQKVNAMLERILATSKTKLMSTEVV